MKRWIAPGVLALFVVGMLTYGMNFYHHEQLEQAKEPVRGEITVYTDLPNNLTTMLADRYEVEQNVGYDHASYRGSNGTTVSVKCG